MNHDEYDHLLAKIRASDAYRIEGHKHGITEQMSALMENEGITKAELAQRLGKTRPYVSKLLYGRTNFTLETLDKIAEALNTCLNLTDIFVPKAAMPDAGLLIGFNPLPVRSSSEAEETVVNFADWCEKRYAGKQTFTSGQQIDAA